MYLLRYIKYILFFFEVLVQADPSPTKRSATQIILGKKHTPTITFIILSWNKHVCCRKKDEAAGVQRGLANFDNPLYVHATPGGEGQQTGTENNENSINHHNAAHRDNVPLPNVKLTTETGAVGYTVNLSPDYASECSKEKSLDGPPPYYAPDTPGENFYAPMPSNVGQENPYSMPGEENPGLENNPYAVPRQISTLSALSGKSQYDSPRSVHGPPRPQYDFPPSSTRSRYDYPPSPRAVESEEHVYEDLPDAHLGGDLEQHSKA